MISSIKSIPSTRTVPSVTGFARIQHAPVKVSHSITAEFLCSRCCRTGLPACGPAQHGARIPARDCTRIDDVRLAVHTGMKQTRKRVPQSPLPLLSAAARHSQHHAVKTVLLKRLRPNVRPNKDRTNNSQSELDLSQCFLRPHLHDAEVSDIPRT